MMILRALRYAGSIRGGKEAEGRQLARGSSITPSTSRSLSRIRHKQGLRNLLRDKEMVRGHANLGKKRVREVRKRRT